MPWLLGLLLTILSFENFLTFTLHHPHKLTQQNTVIQIQLAHEMVRHLNAIHHYLYLHPDAEQVEGQLPDCPELKIEPEIHHTIHRGRVFVWTAEADGLMAALQTITHGSALIGRITQRQFVNASGRLMLIDTPPRIPDNSIVYVN